MQKFILFTGLLTVLTSFSFGQCPTAGFSIPDSACAGSAFQVTNTSSGGLSHFWDFCTEDLSSVPQTSLFSSFAGLNFPQQIRMINDNGNHYLFVANLLNNNLLRYDFGSSINNTPVIYDYGTIGGTLNQPAGIDIANENGIWYALISNIGNNTIARIDLGNTISNNTAVGISLGLFNLSTPRGVKIAKDGSDYFAFISNAANNDLTKIIFGNSLTNTPSGFTALTDPVFDVPWGFDIAYDCSAGGWVGFYASTNLSKIHVIDFGTSLTNSGAIVSSISCITNPSGIKLAHEGDYWFLLTNSFTGTEFQKIKFPGNLLTTPTDLVTHNVPQASSPRNIAFLNDSTGLHLFITNNQPSTISKLLFSGPCQASPAISNSNTTVDVESLSNNDYQVVSLEVVGTNGISDYITDSIYISEAPLTDFIYSTACEGELIIFTDSSILNPNLTTTWLWDFGDGSATSTDQNPVHLFPGSNTYNVTLTASYPTGCSNSYSDSIYVAPIPNADFTFQNNQCSFTSVAFTDLSQAFSGTIITEWLWDFGDGTTDTVQNPVHIYTLAGNFTVVLNVVTNSGCEDSLSVNITILPSPEAGFLTTSTCIGETVNFSNLTTIQGGIQINYSWDFGDTGTSLLTDPQHQYAAIAANYDVTLIATAINGCQDTVIENIRISNKPVAQFNWSPLVVCVGNTINFTSTSFGTGGDTILTYAWDFGDGNSSSDINPMYAYGDTGLYDVTLTVISPTSCDSSITQQVYVIPSPTASFTVAGVCLGLTSSFNPLTTTPPNTQIDSIVWSFGDGSAFTGLSSPTHTYSSPGSFEVIMTVYNNLLCTDVFVDSVDIYPLPVADFNYSILCSDSVATFNGNLSIVTGDTIASWLWNFDGLGTANGDSANFAFPNAGNYDVTLIATTSNGCSDTTSQTVTVIQSPEFDFTFNEPCFGLASTFTYVPIGVPVPAILNWDFGDGTASALLNPSPHIYSAVDTFYVSLRVQHNSTGCAATITKPLIVKPYPLAGFDFTNNCENLPIQFNDTSTIQTGSIASWNWDFGSLGTSLDQNPVVTPDVSGTYPVSMTVTSAEGCAVTETALLTVFANPEAAFTPDPLYGSPPLLVTFNNSTTGGVSYFWNFGDGNSGNGTTPTHTYQDTGFYEVILVATSSEGCIDSAQGIVSILIPYMDIAVTKVFATQNGDLLGLSAEIINPGNIPVTSFDLSAIIDNESVITESWSGMLQPGTSFLYEFAARYDINGRPLPGYYCVEASNPNNSVDANQLNNIKCDVIGESFELYAAYPNPFVDELSISFNLPLEGPYNIVIFDAIGKMVYEKMELDGFKGYNKMRLSTPNLKKGIYFIKIEYRDNIKSIGALKY